MKIIFFELDKSVFKNKGIWLIALAVAIKLVMLGVENYAANPFTTVNRAQYLPIVDDFSGKITGELSAAIQLRYTAVTDAQVNLTSLRQKYNNGEINEDDYYTESRTLEQLSNEKELFLTFYSQYTYAREKPEERYLLYDDGWNALLTKERLDWGFVLLVIVLSASVFGREYESEMRNILIATKKGNTHLISAKYMSIFATVMICSLISSVVEYAFFSLKFGLPHGAFPLQSLRYFQDSAFHLTLGQMYLNLSAYRMLGLLLLAVITMLISVWAQKTIVALSASLMAVALPYALPVNASLKYLLPSPLGLILAQGFFRGTQMGEYYQANEVLFNAINPGIQVWLVAGWLLLAGGMMLVIARIYLSARVFPRFRNQHLVIPLVLFILAGLAGCSSPSVSRQPMEYVFNLADDSRFTVVGDQIVSLYPTFLMENLSTHAINDVIRDPFETEDTIDQTVAAVFSRDEKLYYLVKTSNELTITELDPSSYRASILYTEDVSTNPALINSDLEVQEWVIGKANITFFIDGKELYLLSNMTLHQVDLRSGRKETLINNVYSRSAFDGEKFYYIDPMFEIRMYKLASREDQPIANLRADFLYVRGGKIYYRNIDEGNIVYVYDTKTGQNKAVNSIHSSYFACDDDYIYYLNDDDQGYLYRANLQTGVSEFIAPLTGYNIQLIDGYPYVYFRAYRTDFSTETYRIDKQTLTYEKIEEYQ